MSNADRLDPAFVRQLMHELQLALTARNIDGRMFIVGGAALALQYPDDHQVRVTTDIDAVYWPEAEVLAVDVLSHASRIESPGAPTHPR